MESISAIVDEAYYCELSHRSMIHVCGKKTLPFLQGQLTCDVNQITETHSSLALHCNAQGRIISNFRLVKFHQEYYLISPTEMLDIAIKNLNKYAAFSQVDLIDESDQWQHIGILGNNAQSILQTLFNHVPEINDETIIHDDLIIVRIHDEIPRWHVFGKTQSMQNFKQNIAPQMLHLGQSVWDSRNLHNGFIWMTPEISEKFTPHALNFQHKDAISFTKGCYTGQEIIARMHYRGKLKQHLYRAVINCKVIPKLNDIIYSQNDINPIGYIVAACPRAEEGFDILVSMQMLITNESKIHYNGIELGNFVAM